MLYNFKDYKVSAEHVVARTNKLIKELQTLKEDYQNIVDGKPFYGKSMPNQKIEDLREWVNFSCMMRSNGQFTEKVGDEKDISTDCEIPDCSPSGERFSGRR